MNRFYKVTITKRPVGTAIEHREPRVEGNIIVKVTDSTTTGDYKLLAVDADDTQHAANLKMPGVEEVAEADAVNLAAMFQPKHTFTQFNPTTRKEEKVTVPAVDLRAFLEKRQ
jgi:hypothetical protein